MSRAEQIVETARSGALSAVEYVQKTAEKTHERLDPNRPLLESFLRWKDSPRLIMLINARFQRRVAEADKANRKGEISAAASHTGRANELMELLALLTRYAKAPKPDGDTPHAEDFGE